MRSRNSLPQQQEHATRRTKTFHPSPRNHKRQTGKSGASRVEGSPSAAGERTQSPAGRRAAAPAGPDPIGGLPGPPLCSAVVASPPALRRAHSSLAAPNLAGTGLDWIGFPSHSTITAFTPPPAHALPFLSARLSLPNLFLSFTPAQLPACPLISHQHRNWQCTP
jgi:hypothetical protein